VEAGMIKIGLREANIHFSKYIKMARLGQEVILTERGTPVVVIKSIPQAKSAADRVRQLEHHGILVRPTRGEFVFVKPIVTGGQPLSTAVTEERDER
jgi:prevent-host-death family protein